MRAVECCGVCGRVFREPTPRAYPADELPSGIERIASDGSMLGRNDPYRAADRDERLDVIATHTQRRFRTRTLSLALATIVVASSFDSSPMTIAVVAGLVALLVGISIAPRPAYLHVLATEEGLAFGPMGVPLARCAQIDADAIEGLYVRAKLQTVRAEDRRYQLLLVDASGITHTVIDETDDPDRALWLATNIERALGFDAVPYGAR